MRMWMLPPQWLCRNHLLGEHNEIHKMVGTINKGKNIQGYVNNKLIEYKAIRRRHKELVKEMKRRGYNHRSPLPELIRVRKYYIHSKVDREQNKQDLINRCMCCSFRIKKEGGMN